jgi:hypothetical protein
MSRLTKIVLGAIGATVSLGLLHGWLNLGFDPARVLARVLGGLLGFGDQREVAEETRFRVGFLPVT